MTTNPETDAHTESTFDWKGKPLTIKPAEFKSSSKPNKNPIYLAVSPYYRLTPAAKTRLRDFSTERHEQIERNQMESEREKSI